MGTTTFSQQLNSWYDSQTTSRSAIFVNNKKQRPIKQFCLISGYGQVLGHDVINFLIVGNLAPGGTDPKGSSNANYKCQEIGWNFPLLSRTVEDKLIIIKPLIYISFDGWTKERNYACQIDNFQHCDKINFEIHHKKEVIMITQKGSTRLQLVEAENIFGTSYKVMKQACNTLYSKYNQ